MCRLERSQPTQHASLLRRREAVCVKARGAVPQLGSGEPDLEQAGLVAVGDRSAQNFDSKSLQPHRDDPLLPDSAFATGPRTMVPSA